MLKTETILCGLLLMLAGCRSVPVSQLGLVSKQNMVFGESAVYQYQDPLLSQIEPGVAFSGGAPAAGCTSCK